MKIQKFKKRPVVIEAVQLTKDNANELALWCGATLTIMNRSNFFYVVIPTLEGSMCAHQNDWIIKGIKDEFYPCKPDIFELTYEKVDDEI